MVVRSAASTKSPSLVAFDEEGPPLRKEDFELREVHHGGVGLHLPEIRVDGGVQGQVGTEPGLDIEAESGLDLGRVLERIGLVQQLLAGKGRVCRHVGYDLDGPARIDRLDTGEVSEPGRPARLVPRDGHPEDVLVLRGYVAVDVDPPRLPLARTEPEL
jgi:hypothetical protein